MTALFTSEELADFEKDGFLVVRSLLPAREIGALADYARRDGAMSDGAYGREDASGQPVRLALWNTAGDEPYGLVSRLPRIVDRMEQLLSGEVYLWHTKMILKEPRVGGAWEWHQDYGYWYDNGCLTPQLASCWIAVDRATRENGCLQVLRGSQHIGRIDHNKTGDQTGADMERVEAAMERYEHVHVEAEPGDAIFLHCNSLHRSDQNRSDNPRWSLICCYNAAENNPYKESRHPRYTPLAKVKDTAIADWAADSSTGGGG